MENRARDIAEKTARDSYGQLLAWLVSKTNDITMAEDALAEAFAKALKTWPEKGIPDNPNGWILTVARRKLLDVHRHRLTITRAQTDLTMRANEANAMIASANANDNHFDDERLKLMFICAHPAIDPSIRTPLMLQTVLGLDATKIARAFLMPSKTMSQRLVRAKRKIAATGIPFETPDTEDLFSRLDAVLATIYAAYNTIYDFPDLKEGDLTQEALFLSELVVKLSPERPEALGLFALIRYIEARKKARLHNDTYIPIDRQDTTLWDRAMIAKAASALTKAGMVKEFGRYQLEAAIQSAHTVSRLSGRSSSAEIVLLYDRLIDLSPSIGAYIGKAAALLKNGLPSDALAILNSLDRKKVDTHQPFWATRAHVLKALDQDDLSQDAFERAIELTDQPATKRFLLREKTR